VLSLMLGILTTCYALVFAVVVTAGEARPFCPKATESNFYFPDGILESRTDLDEYVRAWYSKPLRIVGEPSLSCGQAPGTEVYRFLWLRTFHHPISIRVTRSDNKTALVAAELTGAGGSDPGSVARRVDKILAIAEWKGLEAALSGTAFWKMSTRQPDKEVGLDGAQWIVEGRRVAEYHVVHRWTPRTGSYREAGLHFLELSGLRIPQQELY